MRASEAVKGLYFSALEANFQPKLNFPRSICSGIDCAKSCTTIQIRIGISQHSVVQQVKCFRPEFDLPLIPDGK